MLIVVLFACAHNPDVTFVHAEAAAAEGDEHRVRRLASHSLEFDLVDVDCSSLYAMRDLDSELIMDLQPHGGGGGHGLLGALGAIASALGAVGGLAFALSPLGWLQHGGVTQQWFGAGTVDAPPLRPEDITALLAAGLPPAQGTPLVGLESCEDLLWTGEAPVLVDGSDPDLRVYDVPATIQGVPTTVGMRVARRDGWPRLAWRIDAYDLARVPQAMALSETLQAHAAALERLDKLAHGVPGGGSALWYLSRVPEDAVVRARQDEVCAHTDQIPRPMQVVATVVPAPHAPGTVHLTLTSTATEAITTASVDLRGPKGGWLPGGAWQGEVLPGGTVTIDVALPADEAWVTSVTATLSEVQIGPHLWFDPAFLCKER